MMTGNLLRQSDRDASASSPTMRAVKFVRPVNRPLRDPILYAGLLENRDVVKLAWKVLCLVSEKLQDAYILGTAFLGDRRVKMQALAVILVPLHPRQRL